MGPASGTRLRADSSGRARCPGRRSRRWSAEEPMRRPGLLLWPAAVALGLWAEWVAFGWSDPRHWIPDLVTGWTLICCGLVASARRPESRSGALMTVTGFGWFLGNFAGVSAGVVAWVASS